MWKFIVLLLTVAGAIVWILRDSPEFGEWLRRLTDKPTHLMLIGTSGFEREGRDPEKVV